MSDRPTSPRLLTPLLALGIFALLAATPARAQEGDAASSKFVAQLNASIRKATAASRDMREAARSLCQDLTSSLLDLDAMMRSASDGAYDKMDETQRDGYREAFLRRVMRDCAANAADHMRQSVEIAGVRKLPSGQIVVGTRSKTSDAPKILMWQLRTTDTGKPAVTDVFFEGRSAMLTLREQAIVALQQSGGEVASVIGSLER